MDDATQAALREVFADRPYIRAAWVFGSFARGQAREDSDLDVAILPDKPLDGGQKMDLVEALAQRFGRPVDVVDLSVHHGPIAYEAMAKGELVYCPDRDAYAERLRRMLYDQEDFVPVLRSADRMAIEKWLKTSYAPKSAP
ncbi:MAG: nucleotidyltransferase domain-containing protein [Sinimarinibacterium sp.]